MKSLKNFSEQEQIAILSLHELSKSPSMFYFDHLMKVFEEESKKSLDEKKRDLYDSKIKFLDDRIANLHRWLDENPDHQTRVSIMVDLHKTREQRTLMILFPHY